MQEIKLLENIVSALEDKKGKDIITLDVREKTTLCDYFVIAGASSSSQVRALAEGVDQKLSKLGIEKRRAEGISEGRWVVLDYADVIVHIFHDETRLFYHIERLWADAPAVDAAPKAALAESETEQE